MANLQQRITDAVINKSKPRDKEWFIKDTELKGFQVKILPSGQAVYQVEARLGGTGKVKKFKIGNVSDLSANEARERSAAALNAIRNGIDPLIEKRRRLHEGLTFKELVDLYLGRPNANLKQRTVKDYKDCLRRYWQDWADKRVVDIDAYQIIDWYKAGSKTPTSRHNAFRYLNALMNYAIGVEIIKENPCVLVTKSRIRYVIKPRNTYIRLDGDIQKFLRAFIEYPYRRDSQKAARDLILLALLTGMRFGEVSTLKFSNIDFERKYMVLPDTKNRKDHVIPLTPITYAMLLIRKRAEELQSEPSDFVFRIKGGKTKSPYITDIRKTLNGVCSVAGIKTVTSHDLRRTFSSALNDLGISITAVSALMNHSSKNITEAYIQHNIPRMRNHLEALVDYYDKQVVFPENLQRGLSPIGAKVLQGYLYGNKVPEFDPIDPKEYEHSQERDEEYWEGEWIHPPETAI